MNIHARSARLTVVCALFCLFLCSRVDAETMEVTVDIPVPSAVSVSELAVIGTGVVIQPGVRIVTPQENFAGVASLGPDTLQIGYGSHLGSVRSVGSIRFQSDVHIHGAAITSGAVLAAPPVDYKVDDGVFEHRTIPTRHLVRRASFEVVHRTVVVQPNRGQTALVAPGYYDKLAIRRGGEAVLAAGSYYFRDLEVGPGAKLTIDDSGGTVFVYVGDHFVYSGQVASQSGEHPRWLLSYVGVDPIILSAPFRGAVVAPNALVQLSANGAQYEGSFHARTVHIHSDVKIVHRALPWVIRAVRFDKSALCSGETVHLGVDAEDPANPGTPAYVTVNGIPLGAMFDQIVSAPGKHLYAVSATAADGTQDSLLASVEILPCVGTAAVLPTLSATVNMFRPDTVDFTVLNPDAFAQGTPSYEWDFGDGTTAVGPVPTISHDYSGSVPSGTQYRAFDASVTVKRPGVPDATARRTIAVWSTYEMSRARGSIEPPTEPVDSTLKEAGGELTGEIEFKNREAAALSYDLRRIDQTPCDPDAAITYGAGDAVAITVPAHGSVKVGLQVPGSAVHASTCGLTVRYFGQTATGTPAEASVHFDRPTRPGQGAPAEAALSSLLNYAVDSKLVASPFRVSEEELVRLYRERRLPLSAIAAPVSAMTTAFGAVTTAEPTPARRVCEDPDNPGSPPEPGFSCQPTGKWEVSNQHRIQNALKGDAVLVRGCAGPVAPLLSAVQPPQRYTHIGIMTKHHVEIAQSTGDDDWLAEVHPSGVAGQPTDGFEEGALRYLWPGTLVSSVLEAFAASRKVKTPEGQERLVKGFTNTETRCPQDPGIVYPRVLKPPPLYEEGTRPRLMAAGDAAKSIRGHYRFSNYSEALDTPVNDPNGPLPVPSPPGSDTYGPVPTVCSSFVRFSLKSAGFELDRNKFFPTESDVRSSPADGLYFYDVTERKNGAEVLYAYLYNKVSHELALITSATDDFWWVGAAGTPVLGPIGALSAIGAAGSSGTLVKWATDAPDDVANQVTNCFASDFCSEDAKDSDAWKEPGNGVAVSPDNVLDHFDSPATGGPYGYSEKMVYRGRDFRPVYEWRPHKGSLTLHVVVKMPDGAPAPDAQVTIPGFTTSPRITDASGRVTIEGVFRGNILIHAQKCIGDPASCQQHEADACYVPAHLDDETSQELLRVDCADFAKVVDPNPVTEAVVILSGPREDFRKVTFSADVALEDCNCFVSNDYANKALFRVCRVSPLEPVVEVSIPQTDLCVDEIGVKFVARCELQPDKRTVRVTGHFKLYEDVSGSCGANDEEASKDFDFNVLAGETSLPFIGTLVNHDVCPAGPFPSSCIDRATIGNFRVFNDRDD